MKRTIRVCLLILCLVLITPAGSVRAEEGNSAPGLELLWSILFGSGHKQEQSGMTHEETVAAFRELGITIPDEAVLDTERSLKAMNARIGGSGISWGEQPWDFALMLLDRVGWGAFDYETGEWTPTSSDVYAFDAEVFDICHMYTLFLEGVSSIVPGFVCTDVTEVIDEWDEAKIRAEYPDPFLWHPEGTVMVSFTLNGRSHEMELNYYGDWFDETAIDKINEILALEGFPGRLRAYMDGGQGVILFYGDDAFAARLEEIVPTPYR